MNDIPPLTPEDVTRLTRFWRDLYRREKEHRGRLQHVVYEQRKLCGARSRERDLAAWARDQAISALERQRHVIADLQEERRKECNEAQILITKLNTYIEALERDLKIAEWIRAPTPPAITTDGSAQWVHP